MVWSETTSHTKDLMLVRTHFGYAHIDFWMLGVNEQSAQKPTMHKKLVLSENHVCTSETPPVSHSAKDKNCSSSYMTFLSHGISYAWVGEGEES